VYFANDNTGDFWHGVCGSIGISTGNNFNCNDLASPILEMNSLMIFSAFIYSAGIK
jgi:hypothetical protein